MSRTCRRQVFVAAVVAAGTLGCGKSHPDIVPVKGKVLLDGRPVTVGWVQTIPDAGRGAKGTIQPDGSFELGTMEKTDGAKVGTHLVAVVAYEGGVPPGPEAPPGKLLVPKKYTDPDTSDLTIEVKADEENAPVLELTSR